jgi:DNA-binding NtrC family response regulator
VKASELHLLELLELRPDIGSISFRNRRMLLWDADAFGHLRKELLTNLGPQRAKPILARFGFANGYRDALTTRELFNWDNDREWWLSCPALQKHEGKVRPEPVHLSVDRDNGIFEMEVLWEHSYEADQHKRSVGRADSPVCWTLTGYASGFSSALMGEEVFVVEQECAATGGDRCRVVGKTRRAWGDLGDDIAKVYEAKPLSEELEAREAELARQQRILARKERELAKLRGPGLDVIDGIVAKSKAMGRVLELAQTVARVDTTVLVTGESGVGKERLAKFIHNQSPRHDDNFLAVNCGALPEPLLESELFGHTRGSFTGATSDKKGLFEAARGGTLFLDEIGETSPATQVKLLRVLQEREVLPVGATEPRPIDVRVLAATNRSLEQMVADGTFRKDLYYRLNVVTVDLPPLRTRQDDVLPLARQFIAQCCRQFDLEPRSLAADAAEALLSYAYPGNVRELQNAIERAVVVSKDATKIRLEDLPASLRGVPSNGNGNGMSFGEVVTMADLEKRYVLTVLERFDGNRTHTAKALGIGANTLWRKLKAWGVPPARG